MKGNGDRNVEEMLRSAELKPAPPGLREKVLKAAANHKEEAAWTTPLLRWCLAGCVVALSVIFVADGLVTRTQQNRLQAVLDGFGRRRTGRTMRAESWPKCWESPSAETSSSKTSLPSRSRQRPGKSAGRKFSRNC